MQQLRAGSIESIVTVKTVISTATVDSAGGRRRRTAKQSKRTNTQEIPVSDVLTTSSAGSQSSHRRRRQKRLDSTLAGVDAGLAEMITQVVTFRGEAELLRASRLSAVMRRGAAIFEISKGSASTWAMSEEVKKIDSFISHNWSVHRRHKFLCLSTRFNLRLGVLSAVATLGVIAVTKLLGISPLEVDLPSTLTDGVLTFSPGCILLVTPTFLFVMCFGHELLRLAGYHGCRVFLDKTCIHQVDQEMQQKGILKLGAFLRHSSQMVVVYTDTYLTKLWTVYEVACFLSQHAPSNLIVVPTHQPMVVFGGTIAMYLSTVLYTFLYSYGSLIQSATYGLAACGLTVILRRCARSKEAIRMRVANFKVADCVCYCEEDRPVVYQNIALLMRAIGVVRKEATEEEALEAFNAVVRERLATSLTASIGPLGLGYFQLVVVNICNLGAQFVDLHLGVLPYPEEWVVRYHVCGVIWYTMWIFGLFPLVAAAVSKWCGLCLHYKGYKEWLFIGLGAFLLLMFGSALLMMTDILWMAAVYTGGRHRDIFAAGHACLLIVSTALAITVFSAGRRLPEDEWETEDEIEEETEKEKVEPEEEDEEEEDDEESDYEADHIEL